MKKRNAFTLIEILVVLVIVAMLMWVLFEIYITISRITFRVELQKNINDELLFVTDTLQNLSNKYQIDYSEYDTASMFTNKWLTDTLYLYWEDLSWEILKISVYASGCDSSWNYCRLFMNNDGKRFPLTQDKVLFKNTKFKIIPFEKIDYQDWISHCEEEKGALWAYECRNNQWFWFITQMYSQNYDKDRWTHNVYLNVQQFFNN